MTALQGGGVQSIRMSSLSRTVSKGTGTLTRSLTKRMQEVCDRRDFCFPPGYRFSVPIDYSEWDKRKSWGGRPPVIRRVVYVGTEYETSQICKNTGNIKQRWYERGKTLEQRSLSVLRSHYPIKFVDKDVICKDCAHLSSNEILVVQAILTAQAPYKARDVYIQIEQHINHPVMRRNSETSRYPISEGLGSRTTQKGNLLYVLFREPRMVCTDLRGIKRSPVKRLLYRCPRRMAICRQHQYIPGMRRSGEDNSLFHICLDKLFRSFPMTCTTGHLGLVHSRCCRVQYLVHVYSGRKSPYHLDNVHIRFIWNPKD